MKKLYLTFVLFCSVAIVYGQTEISGTITDPNTGIPVLGASVIEKGTSNGTTSDFDGNYSLTISEENFTLVISYLGFKTVEVVGEAGRTNYDIALEEDLFQLNDVVVTSNKTSQSVQDVPLSVSVIGTKELAKMGSTEFTDYAVAIPNLSFGTQGAGSGVSLGRNTNQISLRGVSGTNTTAFYLDDTPLPENIDPRVLDISRVEVLRGPQGTLYGSNTLGGAIRIITNSPTTTKFSGNVSVNAANVDEGDFDYGINGTFNIPLVQNKLGLRLSGFYDFETGVLDRRAIPGTNVLNNNAQLDANVLGDPVPITTDGCIGCDLPDEDNIDDENQYGYMASLGFTPSEKTSIFAKVLGQSTRAKGSNMRDGNVDNFIQSRGTNVEEYFDEDWTFYSLSAKFEFGKGELVTSTSYFDQLYEEQEDEGSFLSTALLGFNGADNLNYWGGFIRAFVDYNRFTHETRYRSKSDGKFNFVLGIFYSKEDIVHNSRSNKPGFITFLGAPPAAGLENIPWFNFDRTNDQSEFSVFGEAYYDITNKLKFTAGLRVFNAKKEVDGLGTGGPFDFVPTPVNGNFEESGVSPKFGLQYQIDENKLLFANVARGFRLGDVNPTVPPQFCSDELAALEASGGSVPESFESDFLWNYELGFKGTLADGRLILNSTIFYNDWTNFRQLRFFESCGFGFEANVGRASTLGLEIESQAKLSKNLKLGLGLGITDAEIREGGEGLLAEPGDDVLFTPSFTGNLNFEYNKSLSDKVALFARYDLQYAGERTSVFNPEERPERVFDPYTLMNFRLGLNFSKSSITLFAQNLGGENANFGDVLSVAAETPGRPRFRSNRPRTIGLQYRYNF